MNYEVQTYDTTDNTVYYETVEDAIDYEDARDIIAEKYPNRKVLAVIGKKKHLKNWHKSTPQMPLDAL
jgi:hypothetical protein